MIQTELGQMRRTHYSDELTPDTQGRIVVMGWVAAVRGHGAISFLTIRDRHGEIQVVAKAGSCPDEVREHISHLRVHSSVAIAGTASPSPKSPRGVEIIPDELRVFAKVEKTPPFEPQARTVKNIDTRLEARPIDLRRQVLQDVFYARSDILRSIRGYFYESGFTEISTPKIIATATEGGAALFPIFYYDRQAYLAQSPQLYKEQLTMGFEKVFEIAPIFRAEPSRTNRHLSEAISVDFEEAFVDYTDVMARIGRLIGAAADAARRCADSGAGFEVPAIPDEIPQYTYSELVEKMHAAGLKTEWGDDLYPSGLKKIGLEGFYFITDWPLGPKPFYVKPGSADSKTSESFDLMFGGLEISSGSTRIEKRDELEARLKNKGMDPDKFGHHLEAFEYGMPPHAGCGIGLERLMMALTGVENIRDATFYPRDADRLTP